MTEADILKYRYQNGGNNYILLGNQQWIAFTKNVIKHKLIPKYGTDFNLIVYWHKITENKFESTEIEFICIPYSAVAHLLTDEHLTGRHTTRERWNCIIKDNLLCVRANTNFSINITPYLNRMENLSDITRPAQSQIIGRGLN